MTTDKPNAKPQGGAVSSNRLLGHGIPAMVFDVESIGLHGEGYAVGYVVIHNGQEVESDMFACPCGTAEGVDSDRLWVYENIPALKANSPDPFTVREKFWRRWAEWKAKNALLAADCAWPVEARFLAACVDALPNERRFAGPYPLVEISSVMMAVGQDPMKCHARNESELPKHNPLADARQSARLLLEAIEVAPMTMQNTTTENAENRSLHPMGSGLEAALRLQERLRNNACRKGLWKQMREASDEIARIYERAESDRRSSTTSEVSNPASKP